MEQQLSPLPTASSPAATSDGATSGRGALAALGQLGLARVLGLGLTALGLLGFFAFLMLRVVEPDYTLLYGGLDLEDSGQIVSKLEAMSSGASSLRAVHKVFIGAAALMALILVGWGFSTFRATEQLASLGIAAVGMGLFMALAAYGTRLGRTP